MFKPLFSLFIALLIAPMAFAKTADTLISYLKGTDSIITRVSSLENADYVRFILPPDSGDTRPNIKEFYKSGTLKLVGKMFEDGKLLNPSINLTVTFDGDCISYYPTGKKKSIIHYKAGYKQGMEYIFYPSGKLYYSIKHYDESDIPAKKPLYWDCYDTEGRALCEEGNGKWMLYNKDFKEIIQDGGVKSGHLDGECHRLIYSPDTLKILYQFKRGLIVSSSAIDKKGNTYPFKVEFEKARYRTGELTFLEILRSHIRLPRDTNGKKMSMDMMHIFFVVEKDGHLDNFMVSGDTDTLLRKSIFEGLAKCNAWTPTKIYGIPYRTQIELPMQEIREYSYSASIATKRWVWQSKKEIFYLEKVLKDTEQ